MTPRGKRITSFAVASVLASPFILVLLMISVLNLLPEDRKPSPIAYILLHVYYVLPTPVGMAATVIAGISVYAAFRSLGGSMILAYPLAFYPFVPM